MGWDGRLGAFHVSSTPMNDRKKGSGLYQYANRERVKVSGSWPVPETAICVYCQQPLLNDGQQNIHQDCE